MGNDEIKAASGTPTEIITCRWQRWGWSAFSFVGVPWWKVGKLDKRSTSNVFTYVQKKIDTELIEAIKLKPEKPEKIHEYYKNVTSLHDACCLITHTF